MKITRLTKDEYLCELNGKEYLLKYIFSSEWSIYIRGGKFIQYTDTLNEAFDYLINNES